MPLFTGVGGVARQTANMYVGVNGVARRVERAYIGVNGVARQFYGSAPPPPTGVDELGTSVSAEGHLLYAANSGLWSFNFPRAIDITSGVWEVNVGAGVTGWGFWGNGTLDNGHLQMDYWSGGMPDDVQLQWIEEQTIALYFPYDGGGFVSTDVSLYKTAY